MAVRIMLDPGHAGGIFNASPVVSGYYESAQMWLLTHKLKAALENYGFEVGLTRYSVNDDPELTERGRKAKGYDLFISMHSNAAASEAPDAPWIIHFVEDNKTYTDEVSAAVARVIGPVVSRVMVVSEPYYYTKGVDFDRDGNGYLDDEYYGVLFGAKSVGVPGIIIEHSFHTNAAAARWLLRDENLDRLAAEEAEALAKYYGLENKGMTADEKKSFEALEKKVEELERKLKVYENGQVYDNAAVRWAYIDENLPEWAVPTVTKLVNKGILKGNSKNSLELSRLMMRVLVILDRAGIFGE